MVSSCLEILTSFSQNELLCFYFPQNHQLKLYSSAKGFLIVLTLLFRILSLYQKPGKIKGEKDKTRKYFGFFSTTKLKTNLQLEFDNGRLNSQTSTRKKVRSGAISGSFSFIRNFLRRMSQKLTKSLNFLTNKT